MSCHTILNVSINHLFLLQQLFAKLGLVGKPSHTAPLESPLLTQQSNSTSSSSTSSSSSSQGVVITRTAAAPAAQRSAFA
jgi:hypothetical protein